MGRVVLTSSYGLQQKLFGIRAENLDAHAKIAVLLCGEVVLSYSAILASKLTFDFSKRATPCFEAGLISVDRREGFSSYEALVEANPAKLSTKHAVDAVKFLDEHAVKVVPFQSIDLSSRLAENVKNFVYLTERYLLATEGPDRLAIFFSEIDAQKGISLEWALDRMSTLNLSSHSADCANLLYHLLGAMSVGAWPSWPERFGTVLKDLRTRQDVFVDAPSAPAFERELHKRFSLLDQTAYADLRGRMRQQSINVDFDELPDALSLDRKLITRLSWNTITELAQSAEARSVQALVDHYQTGLDATGAAVMVPSTLNGRIITAIGNLADVIRSEARTRTRHYRTLKKGLSAVTVGSLIAAGAGFVVSPAIGSVLSVGGLCVGIGQYLADKYKERKFERVSALGEKLILSSDRAA